MIEVPGGDPGPFPVDQSNGRALCGGDPPPAYDHPISLTPLDPRAESIVAFLREAGAGELRHAGAASLLEHLLGTYAILRRWEQPDWLAHAGLLHSVYGTPSFQAELLPQARCREVAKLAGKKAERLAFSFGRTPLASLRQARPDDRRDALLMIHMANLADQARAEDGSPGRWLVRLAALAEPLIASRTVRLPLFIAELAAFTDTDEALTRRAYRDATAAGLDPVAREGRLALAAASCAVVPEPCLWLAHLADRRGDRDSARLWSERAIRRQLALGTAWDKRLSYEEWLQLAEALQRGAATVGAAPPEEPTHPRALLEAVLRHGVSQAGGERAERPAQAEAETGPARFQRYVSSLADPDRNALGAIYPGLASRAWHDPEAFPLVTYLRSHYEEIRTEILDLDPARFQPESEPIRRSGQWDVAFFYERGRRHDQICLACPITARGIEAYPTVRTLGGLIYASRMRPGTHIEPHRGPTNLRLRCHLGLKVPEGDCAIRVGRETRRWSEGECLVFDDFNEHEAWNHTDEDRIVLIVDLWHPGLSPLEVELLSGLQRYAGGHARRLARYWSANEAAGRAHVGV